MSCNSKIKVVGPTYKPGPNDIIVNTTSRSNTWSRGLSPFAAGPVKMPDGWPVVWAHNVENVWQFSKVYPKHLVDKEDMYNKLDLARRPMGRISPHWWSWAVRGWSDVYAHRYPMGKAAKPLFSIWKLNGKQVRLNYIEARWHIYIPSYIAALGTGTAWLKLQDMRDTIHKNQTLCLWDFDGYDHKAMGLSLVDVSCSPKRKMGHAFVLYHLLTGERIIP